MGGVTGYAEAGSLLSYWADGTDLVRRAASFRLTIPPSLPQRANLVIE